MSCQATFYASQALRKSSVLDQTCMRRCKKKTTTIGLAPGTVSVMVNDRTWSYPITWMVHTVVQRRTQVPRSPLPSEAFLHYKAEDKVVTLACGVNPCGNDKTTLQNSALRRATRHQSRGNGPEESGDAGKLPAEERQPHGANQGKNSTLSPAPLPLELTAEWAGLR